MNADGPMSRAAQVEPASSAPEWSAGKSSSVRSALWTEQQMDEPVRFELEVGEVCLLTTHSPGSEGINEDAVAVGMLGPDAAVLAIADGMGGRPSGASASALALGAVMEALDEVDTADPEASRTAVLNGFERANRSVKALGVGAATTLAVIEVRGRTVRPYHVGDSQIVVVGQRGRIKYESVPHSPVGYGVEAGLLNPDEALLHEDRHIVSNMVGTDEMRIEVGPLFELAARDTVLLASDGVTDNLLVEEIVQRIRKGPLERCTRELVGEIRGRMTEPVDGTPSKPDDLSCVLFRPRRA
jgi:serine/threonine protein phosphatase PrpC